MQEQLQALAGQLAGCTACRLCETRSNVVFGQGVPGAPVLLVGEGPGQQEDEQGLPFVGRSGQLLDKMLGLAGLSRQENVYIANMVKCRPPQNRDPSPDELEACLPYLRQQVRLLKPKILVCLGRVAAQRIISPGFKVTQQHGQYFERGGMLLMGTFHPAALLRNPNQKPQAMQDLMSILPKLQTIQNA